MKVGDYVRTKDGRISKIEDIQRNGLYVLEDYDYSYKNDWLIKSSPNIIDLIEVGDYVNGHQVIYTSGNINKKVYVEYVNMNDLLEIKLEQITSIVTKEQFENIEYKIGE